MSAGYKKPAFPFYVLGFLVLFGLTLGRWICGWLCPFGWVQDLVYRIPFFRKLRTFRFDRYLRWLKYAVLGILVIGLPLYSALKGVLVPWFCKLLCPAGTLLGGVPPAESEAASVLSRHHRTGQNEVRLRAGAELLFVSRGDRRVPDRFAAELP